LVSDEQTYIGMWGPGGTGSAAVELGAEADKSGFMMVRSSTGEGVFKAP